MKTGHIKEAKVALEAAKSADPTLEETTVLLSNIRDEFAPERKKYAKKGRKGKKGKAVRAGKAKASKKKSAKAKPKTQ